MLFSSALELIYTSLLDYLDVGFILECLWCLGFTNWSIFHAKWFVNNWYLSTKMLKIITNLTLEFFSVIDCNKFLKQADVLNIIDKLNYKNSELSNNAFKMLCISIQQNQQYFQRHFLTFFFSMLFVSFLVNFLLHIKYCLNILLLQVCIPLDMQLSEQQ